MSNTFCSVLLTLVIAAGLPGISVASDVPAGATSTATPTRLPIAPQRAADELPDAQQLARVAPGADAKMLGLALDAVRCARAAGIGLKAQRLAVIDYRLASVKPRLWVFDLAHDTLLFHELVAHGKGSGDNYATQFSNVADSHASSLGLFITGAPYTGHNGYSLRLNGLEPGFNDASMSRAIVIHGAAYVSPAFAKRVGRLGRSWGCPAVGESVIRPIIDVLKNGQFVFAYYPDQAWLTQSTLLRCAVNRAARASTARQEARPNP